MVEQDLRKSVQHWLTCWAVAAVQRAWEDMAALFLVCAYLLPMLAIAAAAAARWEHLCWHLTPHYV